MAQGEGRKMTLSAKKIGGNRLLFTYNDGRKSTTWETDATEVDVEVLRDIVDTVVPPLPPTVPAIPLVAPQQAALFVPPAAAKQPVTGFGTDWGFEEEVRLKNMGAALNTGVGLAAEDIPVFNGEPGDQLPPVNWGV